MHTIRLRGPWEREPHEGGQVRYARRFHLPTGLDSGERVWLVIEVADGEVSLNGQLLGSATGQFDVTRMLEPTNRLVVTAASGLSTDGLAWLEIG